MIPLAAAVLVLRLWPQDTGLAYGLTPTPSQLTALTDRLVHDLRAQGLAVRTSPVPCDDVACARRVGRAAGAETVIFGATIREMAMIWATSATVVDVATGQTTVWQGGYKGDYQTMLVGIDAIAPKLAQAVRAGPRPPVK
ncbi:MAG: hypothetical protein ACREM2_10015 [Vulcanimicrobiaceae bacterium]